ncbi:MAG: TIGR00300 family protein [Actinobacteria bacterium]|nr:TIGR00300 family protein [Actinomycetota bacterium]
MPSETVTLSGHIIDNLTLPNVLDEVVNGGFKYRLIDLNLGVRHDDTSTARIEVTTGTEEEMTHLLDQLRAHGANPETVEDARLIEADMDGALPPGFYSSTNLETDVRIDGKWLRVTHPEMDCGIVVEEDRARTVAMGEITKGMKVVMSGLGIRALPIERTRGEDRGAFEFMSSDLSSEKPKGLLLDQVADQMRAVKAEGKRILWVVGPALVHTGTAPDISALIRAGYVDALFAGNGVAAHDVESNIYGTSLGVHLDRGTPAEHGHEHHIRAVNEVRRHGSFKAAIDAGVFKDGIVYHLIKHEREYLFGGSVRDDGPMPETVTDMMEVQRRLRDIIWGHDGTDLVGCCIVVGTMLHGIATGNCLPASVPLVCVDINQATVTKLMDRGSWQSIGIITDLSLFVRALVERLAPGELDRIG